MTTKTQPSKPKPATGPIRSISIEKAENGWTVTCRRETKNPMEDSFYGSTPMVFESSDSAIAYVKEEMGEKKEDKKADAS